MSIATVVTRGYGSFGSIADVAVRGYLSAAFVTSEPQTGAAGNWNLNKLHRRAKTLRELQAQWKQVREDAERLKVEIPNVAVPAPEEILSERDRAIAELIRQSQRIEHETYLRKIERELLESAQYLRDTQILQEDEEFLAIIMAYMAKRGLH